MRTLSRVCVPVLIASATLLSACSTNAGYGNPTGSGLSTVSVTGDFDKLPTVSWKAVPDYPSKTTVSTAITGTGAAIPADTSVEATVYVSDAQAILQAASLCQTGKGAGLATPAPGCSTTFPLTAPATNLVQVLQKAPYQALPATAKTITIPSSTTLFSPFRANARIGSRVIGLMPSSMLGGVVQSDSIPTIGIGNHDAVLVIVDFVKLGTVECPSSTATPTVTDVPAADLPAVVQTKGKPSGLTFTGVKNSACGSPVRRAVITQGTGPAISLTDSVTVNYLGEVFNGKAPFDESFSKKPATLVLNKFVPGFAYGLNGLKVGSRVVLAIPANAAYGAQANGGIPASSTLYFVVDITANK